MNRTAALFVALVVCSVAVLPAGAIQTGASASPDASSDVAASTSAAPHASQRTDSNESIRPGEHLSGVIGVQEAEIDGEMESRSFDHRVANADSERAKARVVADQLNQSQARLDELEQRLESLQRARENGSISRGTYAARVAQVQAELHTVQRMSNQTAAVSERLPRETLEANGVNVTAIETLRQHAANMSGPEVAATARTIAGPGAGRGLAADNRTRGPGAGQGPGQTDDRPRDADVGNRTDTGDRPDGNRTAPGAGTGGDRTTGDVVTSTDGTSESTNGTGTVTSDSSGDGSQRSD